MLHLGVAVVLLWLSAVLILPAETFESSRNYRLLGALAPEWAWSLLLGAGAGAGLWGAATASPRTRHLSCALLSLLHTLLAMCVLLSNPASTASGTYSILGLLALLRLVAGR